MFALTRILVPSNLGEPSRAAIKYGVAFARQFDAKLYVVRVLSNRAFDAAIETERVIETLLPETAPNHGRSGRPNAEDIARNAAREELGSLLDSQQQRDTRAEYLLRDAGSANPGDEIAACARELDVELIVMGKHRLGIVERLLAGSVTEKLIRQAPCPVLIVQHPEHDFVVENRNHLR